MGDELNPVWERHFEGTADELLHLAVACDVRLRDPGMIERILRNDRSVCGRSNDAGFEKMRNLLNAYYDSLGKAVDRIGPEETKKIVDALTARKSRQRDSAGACKADVSGYYSTSLGSQADSSSSALQSIRSSK